MLYELTMFGRYFNQQIINRFNYVSTGEPASVLGSFALTAAFGAIAVDGVDPTTTLFYKIRIGLVTAYVVESIVVRAASLYAPTDFYERPFVTPVTGLVAEEGLSPASAIGYRTNRVRLDIDRGTKRFVGVPEIYTQTGGVITAAALPNYTDCAEAMSDNLVYDDEGATVTFAPCIVSKKEYTTPKGNRAYEYYPTLAEQLTHIATGIVWQPYTNVRTQTSRQYGRGG